MQDHNIVNLITVNFNSSEETISMIKSIDNDYVSKIIVVDNCSTHDQCTILSDFILHNNKVHLMKLETNIGYFPALNKGLEALSDDEKKTGYTIICNNDLLFNSAFFEKLLNRSFGEGIMAVSPSVKTINGVYQNPSLLTKPSRFRYFGYRLYYSNYFIGKTILKLWRSFGFGIDTNYHKDTIEKEIFVGIGAIFILLPSFFEQNYRLNYPLFLYGEEIFLSHQLNSSGGRLLYVPDMEVIHLESVTTKEIPSKVNYMLNKKAFLMSKDFYK